MRARDAAAALLLTLLVAGCAGVPAPRDEAALDGEITAFLAE